MKSYAMWPSMIAGVAVIATLFLSTHAMATHISSEDAFAVPALSLMHFTAGKQSDTAGLTTRATLASLAGVPGRSGLAGASLLSTSSHSAGFSGDAAMRKRSRRDRSAEEEAVMQQYMGYMIMITGGALVVVGGIGLVASTKAPAGTSGTVALLGLGAIAGGGFLIYWGYQYKQEADKLAGRMLPSPLMVGYAGTF